MANRVIIHCDADNFYASVEEKHNPALRGVPFAVCGDREMRHSIVMTRNGLAKKAGVPSGISFAQARRICPELLYVTADISKYYAQTELMREIFNKYSESVHHYGPDESWIDLGKVPYREAEQIADLIRIEVKYAHGLSASLGVSYNLIYAKIGSDYRKPDAVSVITQDNYEEIVWPLPAEKLIFIGEKRKNILNCSGITTIGDVAKADPLYLGRLLGKVGYDLWCYANGNDRHFKPNTDRIGSIGNTITPPADLMNNHEVSATLYMLATAVCARLKKHGLKARCVRISMRDSAFNKTTRQTSFFVATDNVNYVFNKAYELFTRHYKWHRPLRSVGLCADNLDNMVQLTLEPYDKCELSIDIDARIRKLVERIGTVKLEQSSMTKDWWVCVEDIPS